MKSFGDQVAVMDLDGDGILEVVVADPRAIWKGDEGRMHIFRKDWSSIADVLEEHIVGDPAGQEQVFVDLHPQTHRLGVQITGLIARRIVCQPAVGEWLVRGVRYGLIRFGSRTDVVLPIGSEARVAVGDRVRGGSSVIAVLAGDPA